ncbi:MAG TPA: ECF transporter S component [Clostridiales bacterium]|nr:ECF transporter S component [Clostridiales bacterium]
MTGHEKTLWITRTGVMIALLIVMQAATAPLGSTLITGSIVNLLLIVAVMIGGLTSGLSVAILSPVIAKLLGIGPLWELIPFIAVGNMVLVLLWHIIGNRNLKNKLAAPVIALVTAAVAKFLVLYFGIVVIAIPLLLNLPEKQALVISSLFSYPQLITATIGGVLALTILPVLKKALRPKQA